METEHQIPSEEMDAPVEAMETPVDAPVEASATEAPEGETLETPEETAWKASNKYKVKDEEHDIPEWAQKLITDEATEKEMKALFSKGHGIEDIKSDRQTLREELNEIRTQKESLDQGLATVSAFVEKGDFKSFFEALEIPEDQIINYAIETLKYREMAPEQRQEIDNARLREQQLMSTQHQNQTLQEQMYNIQVEQKRMELTTALSEPTTASIVTSFNSKHGENAFQNEVVKRGQAYHAMGQDVSASHVVNELIGFLGNGYSAEPPTQPPQTATPGQVVVEDKPVIPNVQGQASSPVRSGPKSIEDLRKLAQSMA